MRGNTNGGPDPSKAKDAPTRWLGTCTILTCTTATDAIPDGGGWRYLDRRQGVRNRAATPDKPRNASRGPKMGTAFVHTVIDDRSRVASQSQESRDQ